MQILSGRYKNLPLKSPHNVKTHPMGSREKLALFNMLLPYLENATVLDAYAGSGALGLEALSRGAKKVVFLEKSPQIAKTLRENLARITTFHTKSDSADLSFHIQPPTIQVLIQPAETFARTNTETFNLIIADPPYDHFEPEVIARLTEFLTPGGILALSHPATTSKAHSSKNPSNTEPPIFPHLTLLKSHAYAAAQLSLFQKTV